jgi:hypothetical protein
LPVDEGGLDELLQRVVAGSVLQHHSATYFLLVCFPQQPIAAAKAPLTDERGLHIAIAAVDVHIRTKILMIFPKLHLYLVNCSHHPQLVLAHQLLEGQIGQGYRSSIGAVGSVVVA